MTDDTPTRLPVLDLSRMASSAELATQLDLACRRFGFFYLVGHGVDALHIDALMQLARTFFTLSSAEKLRIEMSKGGRAWRGYFPLGGELTSGIPDRKEGLYFGTELGPEDARVAAGLPLHGANQFPDLPGFREAVLDYIAALTDVGHRLLAVLARGLGLADDFFLKHYTADPTILFRIFNYPGFADTRHPAVAGSWSVGEHTDYGLLTLLKQDAIGGLQVRNGDHWIDVPELPGSLVCNVGDMLERLTGGRYLSALHRVRNASGQHRMSMALFFDPAFEAKLQPIPSLEPTAAAHTQVRWDHFDPNAHTGTYGEYLLGKVAKVFPDLKDDVLP